ncbi:MAG: DUF4864 domain-containing protein [Pseudomonadota bacterium]
MRAIHLLLASVLASTAPAWAQEPNPGLSPREVVQLQLDALRLVDRPSKDAGFATVFRFTSPENREQTGPLPRFSRMIREGFGELLNHRSAKLPATLQEADRALQPVEITSLAGRTYRYVFVLRRQAEGDYQGCWMTDGVVPQDETGQSQEL